MRTGGWATLASQNVTLISLRANENRPPSGGLFRLIGLALRATSKTSNKAVDRLRRLACGLLLEFGLDCGQTGFVDAVQGLACILLFA
jgi:hypothetical protein